jgi:hypothetical protein
MITPHPTLAQPQQQQQQHWIYIVQHPPYSLDRAPSDFCLQISRNTSQEFISLETKFKLLWENDSENSLEF